MIIELYIITTILSTLYILCTELDGTIVIDKNKKILDIFILCFIVFFINWIVTPVVILNILERFKK